jgi:hypothetical protein
MGRANVLFADRVIRRQPIHERLKAEFPYRVAKRRNLTGHGARWCPIWLNRVRRAANGFGFEFRLVKGAVCFRTKQERDLVAERADVLWRNVVAVPREEPSGTFDS